MRKYMVQAVLIGLATTAVVASAQVWSHRQDPGQSAPFPNPTYDGRYAFARLRYAERNDPCICPDPLVGPILYGWAHEYPEGDRNLMHIATDLTAFNAWTDSTVVVRATDPELMRYPILYLSEPGCWQPSDAEVQALRTYLLKGGFLIVDDFMLCDGGAIRYETSRRVFEAQIRRVLPEGRLVPVDWTAPELNSFYHLEPRAVVQELTAYSPPAPPQVYGIYDRNDPKRRLLVAANYNTVIHRVWVWEAQGLSSVARGNEAYKLGVNYLLYGFTH